VFVAMPWYPTLSAAMKESGWHKATVPFTYFERRGVQRGLPSRLVTAIVIYFACPWFTSVGHFWIISAVYSRSNVHLRLQFMTKSGARLTTFSTGVSSACAHAQHVSTHSTSKLHAAAAVKQED
jgi:hypothetical protein